ASDVYKRQEIMSTSGPLPLREELAALLRRGVAYHHAGLSSEQRRIIEDAFRRGGVAVLHATPTLAAGVNLPARLVVIEEYYRFEDGMRRPIPVFEYKQLSGRAGRPGYDDEGLSVIVAARSDSPEEVASYYILGPVEEVRSRLGSPRGLRHALLSLLTRGPASIESIESFLGATLQSRQDPHGSLDRKARRALSTLAEWGLVEERGSMYSLTVLGMEIARLYLDPESVPILERLSSRARSSSDEVLLYIVASMPDTPRLRAARREQERLVDLVIERYPDILDLVDAFGPEEASIVKTMHLLHLWIMEETEDKILQETGAGPGDVRSITETASWVSSSLSRIAPLVGAAGLSDSFRLISQRLKYGVKPELLPLVSIPEVGRVRARRLYDAGFRTLHDLARASPEELLRIQGLGPSTVRSILETLGRSEEAGRLEGLKEPRRGRGLEAFLDL
ncbi:MAG: helix-hairpin-helix domain-containing protein, partial [Desulfurococcales archaeon]|nr:helix-hairpin-helix domain-containing protein [Desulfurococcales archaeon]